MNANYTLVFNIDIKHTYFSSGICEDLTYSPTIDTKQIIDKYGFIIRKTVSGFQLYSNTNQSIEDYLTYIQQVTETTAFEFTGTAINQVFYNYTAEIPVVEIGVLSYESNRLVNNSVSLQETFIAKSDASHIISIKILFNDIIKAHTPDTQLSYQILLNARNTQWQYYIINNSNQEYTEIAIESNTTEIQFTNEGETTLQNGQKATLFSSGEALIPLKNVAEHKFDIVNTKQTIAGSRKETIFKGLPIPNPSSQIILDNGTIASPMYVYI